MPPPPIGLDDERADAITTACAEIRSGRLHCQFVVDVIQGGQVRQPI